jgi:hypothetical protein
VATVKNVKRLPSGRLEYRGETFSGYNQPKRSKGGSKKSVVLKKASLNVGRVLEPAIIVIPQKISSRRVIGRVRRGK